MSEVNQGVVEIEEVASVLTAAEGVSIYRAIRDAELEGYTRIDVDAERNEATVTWFKRKA